MALLLRPAEKKALKHAFTPFKQVEKGAPETLTRRTSAWGGYRPACKTAEHIENKTFTPTRGQSNNKAKELCMECPLFYVCLEETLLDMTTPGIVAGLSQKERSDLKTAIGKKLLFGMAGQRPGTELREGFFSVLQCVAGFYPLREVPVQEAMVNVNELGIAA